MEDPAWHLIFNLTEFTPQEAEAVTTLSTAMQRDWRQRGFLPRSDKHARFNAIELAELLIMKMLADRGVGPSRSQPVVGAVARSVVFQAMIDHANAWGGSDPTVIFDTIPRDYRTVVQDEDGDSISRGYAARDWLARRMFDALGGEQPSNDGQFVWWPTDEVEFTLYGDEVLYGVQQDAASDAITVDARFQGFALVLPIMATNTLFVARAARPLVRVDVEVFTAAPTSGVERTNKGFASVKVGRTGRLIGRSATAMPAVDARKRYDAAG